MASRGPSPAVESFRQGAPIFVLRGPKGPRARLLGQAECHARCGIWRDRLCKKLHEMQLAFVAKKYTFHSLISLTGGRFDSRIPTFGKSVR